MKGEFRNILKVASIYMTTIIGAGFASGQEIVQFFSSYYEGGFYGILLAGLLFSFMGYVVLDKVYSERIRNYDEFLFPTVGYFWGWVMEIIVTLFMLSLFCIMLAGMGNVFSGKTGISFNAAVLIMSILSVIVILTGIKGIVILSSVVSPVLIVGILTVGLYVLVSKDTSVFNVTGVIQGVTKNWFFSSLIYVSYNSITATVVMCGLLPYLKTRRVGILGGLLGGGLLCMAALILNSAIFVFYPNSLSTELPVLSIVERHSSLLSGMYSVLLFIAMFVSSVTAGYCFIDRVRSKANISKILLAFLICAMAVPLAGFGFSGLIANIYPIFGYVGLFMVFVIIFQGIRPGILPLTWKRK